MSKVKAHLIKVNLKAGNKEMACYIALQNNIDSCSEQANGDVIGSVILDFAYDDVKASVTTHEWAGYLAALTSKGLYKKYGDDGSWGKVIMKAAQQ